MKKIIAPILIALCTATLLCAQALAAPYDDLANEAMSSYKSGDIDASLSKIREIESLGLESSTELSDFVAGQCYAKKGDNAEALKYFSAASANSDFILADYAKLAQAKTLEKLGSSEAAQKEFEQLVLEHPDSVIADRCMLLLGKKNAAGGTLKGAIEIFDMIIYSPDQGDILEEAKFEKGKALEGLKRWKEASDAYFDLAFNSPKSPYSKNALSRINAITKAQKVPYPKASKEEIYNRAFSFYDRGDFSSAAAELYKFLKSYPTGPMAAKARVALAVSEYKAGAYTAAYYKFKNITKWKLAGADEAQFYLTFIYGRWGQFKNAIASLNKVLQYYPSSPFADDAAFYIGYYYDINGFQTRAQQEYSKFLNKYPNSEFCEDALWRIGKYYYVQKNYQAAYDVFSRASESALKGNLTAHCLFWQGMSALKLDRRDDAVAAFSKLTKEHDHTFHSLRAREKLKELKADVDEVNYAAAVPFDSYPDLNVQAGDLGNNALSKEKAQDLREHAEKYRLLLSLGFLEYAEDEANYLVSNASDEDKKKATALYYLVKQERGEYREPLIFAENHYLTELRDGESSRFDYLIWSLAYPKGFWDKVLKYSVNYGIDPYLVLAVIREESRFNPMVVSWARARGLMQIIPPTGLGIARLIGLRPYNTYMLFDPEVNIKMGCYYLASLLKRFNGNPYYAVAAYNGGPLRVKAWLVKWEREVGGEVDIDEFVERIPFSETRRYVQKVINSYNEYRRIYERSSRSETSPGG